MADLPLNFHDTPRFPYPSPNPTRLSEADYLFHSPAQELTESRDFVLCTHQSLNPSGRSQIPTEWDKGEREALSKHLVWCINPAESIFSTVPKEKMPVRRG